MNRHELRELVAADRKANAGYPKSRLIVTALRVTQYARTKPGPLGRAAYLMSATFHRLCCEWLLGVELPSSTRIGPGLRIRHGIGIVVNPAAVIGRNVLIRHGVTIGNRRTVDDCPTIGDDVEIGANAIIIGAIVIGARSRIGAGAVVVTDVPADSVVIPPPALVLNRKAAIS